MDALTHIWSYVANWPIATVVGVVAFLLLIGPVRKIAQQATEMKLKYKDFELYFGGATEKLQKQLDDIIDRLEALEESSTKSAQRFRCALRNLGPFTERIP